MTEHLAPTPFAALAPLIVANAPTPILTLDREARIKDANPAAESWLGAAVARLRGETLGATTAPYSPVAALAAKAIESGNDLSEFAVRADGRGAVLIADVHVFHLAGAPDLGGAVALLLQPHIGEAPIREPAAARSIAGLAATLAHEVKNPLSGIRGAAQLLEAGAALEDKPMVDLICAETDRISALVDRMQAFSDARPAPLQAVNVHEALARARSIAEHGFARHVEIVERYDPSLPPVAGDLDSLIQAFINLVKNAAEACPARGGRIELRTGFKRDRAAGRKGAELPIAIEVRDNGPGAPAELRDHLFDAFVSGRAGGVGLGLALVAKIASDHGGIARYRDLEPGACFEVRLPVWRSGAGGAR